MSDETAQPRFAWNIADPVSNSEIIPIGVGCPSVFVEGVSKDGHDVAYVTGARASHREREQRAGAAFDSAIRDFLIGKLRSPLFMSWAGGIINVVIRNF